MHCHVVKNLFCVLGYLHTIRGEKTKPKTNKLRDPSNIPSPFRGNTTCKKDKDSFLSPTWHTFHNGPMRKLTPPDKWAHRFKEVYMDKQPAWSPTPQMGLLLKLFFLLRLINKCFFINFPSDKFLKEGNKDSWSPNYFWIGPREIRLSSFKQIKNAKEREFWSQGLVHQLVNKVLCDTIEKQKKNHTYIMCLYGIKYIEESYCGYMCGCVSAMTVYHYSRQW